jgi:hypothetical protein
MAVPRKSATSTTSARDGDTKRASLTSTLRTSLQHKLDYAKMPPVYKIPLWELNCQFGIVKRRHASTVLLKDAMKHQRRTQAADVTMLFAIRQPGWAGCREHGLQLTELAAEDRKLALAATVKETGVDDQGLLEFYRDYFHSFPIYMDEKWQLYKAMGGRKLGILTILKGILGARKRFKQKNIKSSAGNSKSEGWMAGGVLVFDKQGELIYVHEEQVGKPFDMDQLKLAIVEARRSNQAYKLAKKQSEQPSQTMSQGEDAQTVRSSIGSDSALE